MKQLLLLITTATLFSFQVHAQRTCGSEINPESIKQNDPERYQRIMEIEQQVARFSFQKSMGRRMRSSHVVTIPVVVHVLHTGQAVGTGLNISLAQIQSQIDVLNEDFRRLNSDAGNTPAEFQNVAADSEIEFVLACVDPNGNHTNGIVRVQTNRNVFDPLSNDINQNGTFELNEEQATGIKFAPNGSPAWPSDRYLNIWVCNLADGLLGYAQFPDMMATQPQTDGVVINTTSFGKTGNISAPFDKGRTTTHEVGHWLNLRHIWGDAFCGNDFVADTPTQSGPNIGCPSHPHVSCGSNDMYMNYMDYSDDGCMNLFSQGQADRMFSLFDTGGVRESFVTCDLVARVCTSTTTISGPDILCTNSFYTLQNPPAGSTVTWSASPSGVVSISGSGGGVNLTPLSDGQATLTASITTACGTIQVGKAVRAASVPIPASSITLEPFESSPYVCPSQTYSLMVSPYVPGYQYEVQVTNGTYTMVSPNQFWIHINSYIPSQCADAAVSARVHNGCEWSDWRGISLFSDPFACPPGGGGCSPGSGDICLMLYPNPSSEEVSVSLLGIEENEMKTGQKLGEGMIYLYDSNGTLRKSASISKEKTLYLRDLPAGQYVLHYQNGKTIIKRQLKIEK